MRKDTNNQKECWKIFYTKDINKKKKVYNQGILLQTGTQAKIYDEDGKQLMSFKNTQKIQQEEEYTANRVYLITIDQRVPVQQFQTGKVFMPQPLLPIKKNVQKKQNKQDSNENTLITMECGLAIQRKIFQILRDHQKEGISFMYCCLMGKKSPNMTGCILADYMGLGKTLQSLVLSYSMLRQGIIKKFLIVCPLTLLTVWEKETKKWLGGKLNPLICEGDGASTLNTVKMFAKSDYRMLVISYQAFYRNIDHLSGKIDLIIFDQGHRLKNKKSKLLIKMKVFKCQMRVLLTGTPIQNNLQELYTCVSLINPRIFQSETIFKNVFQKPILDGMAKGASSETRRIASQRTSQLANQIKQFSLRRTADVLKKYLPLKSEHLIFLTLTPLQKIWYEKVIGNSKQNGLDMFKILSDLRKLFTHPSILKKSKLNQGQIVDCLESCSSQKAYKIEFGLNLISNCMKKGEKIVVVSYFTQTLDFIGERLKQIKINSTKLDGRMKIKDRKASLKKFEAEIDVLLLSGKAGGTGLTLICASHLLMMDPDWNPSNDSQVMGRVWRQGQLNQVNIYRMIIASSFQQKMLQRQGLKKTLADNLIDEGQQNECSNIDFQNLGKLFIEHKEEVISFPKSQNDIIEFMKKKQEQFKQKLYSQGVIFVKTKKTNAKEQKAEQKFENEFTKLNFEQIDDQSDWKESDEQIENLEQIETQIKGKKKIVKQSIKNEADKLETSNEESQTAKQDSDMTKVDISKDDEDSQNSKIIKSMSKVEEEKMDKKNVPLALKKMLKVKKYE